MGGSGGGGERASGPSEGIHLVGLCCGVALKHRLSLSNATGMFICLQYFSRILLYLSKGTERFTHFTRNFDTAACFWFVLPVVV